MKELQKMSRFTSWLRLVISKYGLFDFEKPGKINTHAKRYVILEEENKP